MKRGRCRNHPYHADVVEIIGSRPNEGVPASVAEMLFVEDAVAGNKMAAFVEMNVRRCCEEMLLSFVMAKVVRCWRLWRRW